MGILRARVGGQWVDIGVGQSYAAGRNLLDNGAMQVNQRATTSISTSTGGWLTADRWYLTLNAIGTYTHVHQSMATFGVPLPAGYVPTGVWAIVTSTADGAPATGDYGIVTQGIEGQNLQHLMWGTASALPVTFSGWVYVSTAGKFYLELNYAAGGATATFPLNLVVGWNYFAHTFPGNTVNTIADSAAQGLQARLWFGAGSTYTSGTWAEGWYNVSANRVPGQSNVIPAATSRVLGITQWQLEVGSTATPYEHRPYDQELRKCMRYYERMVASAAYSSFGTGLVVSNSDVRIYIPFSERKRAIPTPNAGPLLTSHGLLRSDGAVIPLTQILNRACDTFGGDLVCSVAGGFSAGQSTLLHANGTVGAWLDFSAEI